MLMYTVEHITNDDMTYESSYFTKEEACAALERSYNTFVKYDKLKQFITGSFINDNRERAEIAYTNGNYDIYNIRLIEVEVVTDE